MVEKTQFPSTTNISCLKCRYQETVTNMVQGQTTLQCRFKPPTMTAMPVPGPQNQVQWMKATFFPQVNASDWCGEYAPKMDS